MSSKLHKAGGVTNAPEVWQPVRAGGRPASASYPERPLGDMPAGQVEMGGRELERDLQERTAAAHRAGVQEGEAAARRAAAGEVQAVLEKLARTIEEIASVRPRLRHEAEADVVKLGMAIARRILNRELSTDPEAVVGLIRAALDKLDGREVSRVRVHPQHAAVLQQIFERMGSPRRIQVSAEPALDLGAAIFETLHGSLDASVETQLSEIERGFADLVRRTP